MVITLICVCFILILIYIFKKKLFTNRNFFIIAIKISCLQIHFFSELPSTKIKLNAFTYFTQIWVFIIQRRK